MNLIIIIKFLENLNMTCPYCPYFIDLMIKDPKLDTSKLYQYELLDKLAQFILRNKDQVKRYIEAYETKNPNLLKNE